MHSANHQHDPALDGVRGLAILLVLLVHFIPPVAMQWRIAEWFIKLFSTGGWVGVDLFFVLSGFLITGILLRSRDKPNFFTNFYMRRVLRIVPIYFLALFLVFAIFPHFISAPRFAAQQANQVFHWLYLTNFGLLMARSAMDSEVANLSSYWSLSVEEHFYLLWPAIIFCCRPTTIRAVCVTIFVSAFVLRCVLFLTFGGDGAIFVQTPCRVDGLAAGALIATLLHDYSVTAIQKYLYFVWAAGAASAAALLGFFLSMKGLWATHWFMETVGFSLINILFAAILTTVVIQPAGLASKIFSFPVLRFLGKYSYGLYVIHALLLPGLLIAIPIQNWLTMFGAHVLIASLSLAFVKIGICTVFAVASFHFYETPFLKLKKYFEPPKI